MRKLARDRNTQCASLNLNKAAFVPEAFNKTAIESIQKDVQLL